MKPDKPNRTDKRGPLLLIATPSTTMYPVLFHYRWHSLLRLSLTELTTAMHRSTVHRQWSSAENGNLFVPHSRTVGLEGRASFIAAPVVWWNSLPLHLRSPSISRSQFRAGLKTHLCTLAFHRLLLLELLKRLNWTELNWTERATAVPPILQVELIISRPTQTQVISETT